MIYAGQKIFNRQTSELFKICHVDYQRRLAAIADMNHAEKADNIRKPDIMSFNEITTLIKKKYVETPPVSD